MNKWLIIIFSFLFVIIFINIFVVKNVSKIIYGVSKIDNVILGDLESLDIANTRDSTINIVDKRQSNKAYNLLTNQLKNIFIGLTLDENGKYVFNGDNNFAVDFNLKKVIADKTNLQFFKNDKGQLVFYTSGHEFLISDGVIKVADTVVKTLDGFYFADMLKINNIAIDVSGGVAHELAVSKEDEVEVATYKSDKHNLLATTTASFEDGLWQVGANDCSNKMNGDPEISMDISYDSTDGERAVKLASNNHFACFSKSFPIKIKEDSLYRFSFDYKSVSGGIIRYYYRLRDERGIEMRQYAVSEAVEVGNNDWNTFSTIINPENIRDNFIYPENIVDVNDDIDVDLLSDEEADNLYDDVIDGVKFIDIYFYAPSNGVNNIVNLYDNVSLTEYELMDSRMVNFDSVLGSSVILSENVSLSSGDNIFEYFIDQKNLLDYGNTSFEDGLWQKEVRDCSDSRPGDPDMYMKISSDATDGVSSLQVYSNNHYACTSKLFFVNLFDDKLYKLNFDYKNIGGGSLRYYYNLKNDEAEEPYSETITVEDNNWHTYETIINPGINGVKKIGISFYAPSDGSKEIVNLYDNVRLTEYLPKDIDSYYLYAEQEVDETPKLKSVEYKAVNRWKNEVVLHGVNNSFLLAYPEKYSEKWKAYPIQIVQDRFKYMGFWDNYFVPEVESNRQASKEEVEEFENSDLISATGDKFISKNFDGSIRNDNMNNGWFWETWGKESIVEEMHYQINNYGNSWWIDLDDLCEKKKICRLNEDGAYDIHLIIEHKHGKFFYLGLLISSVIIFAYLVYLCHDFYKRR